jgi:protein SCO1/2
VIKRLTITMVWLALLTVVTACGTGTSSGQPNPTAEETHEPLNWDVPALEAVDQEGDAFAVADLDGKVWLANFIFTRCPDVCPPMTANMTKVQQALQERGIPVEIVSFSVDPAHDTPEVLKEFAGNYDLSFDNWHFLTGYDQEEINTFARTGFKGDVRRMQEGEDEPLLINHPVSFFLVNPNGKVHERFDGMDPDVEAIAKLIQELEK